jgi:hypothetical protein
MRAYTSLVLVALPVAFAAFAASCSFYDFDVLSVTEDGGGGQGGDASSSSTGEGGTGAATSSSAGGDGGGGGLPPDPKCAGSGGSGGGGGSGAAGGAGGGASGGSGGRGGTGGMIDCDTDRDGETAMEYPCCGTDCDDTDPRAFKFQTQYFDEPNPKLADGGYDYDCDNKAEKDKSQLINQTGDLAQCADGIGGLLCKSGQGYVEDANCGDNQDGYFKCVGLLGGGCGGEEITPPGPLRCK